MSAALDFGGQRRIVHGRKLSAALRRGDTDQARTTAGKRNQRERTFLGVKLG